MYADESSMELIAIGVVHSDCRDRRLMPPHGVPATVEIFPEYAGGLRMIEENTHLWIVAWFDNAERDRTEIIRLDYSAERRRRGVFGLRSTTRPNSLGMSIGKIMSVQGRTIALDALDFLDGTSIVDIKRYSPSWDCIFSARSARDYFQDIGGISATDELEHMASIFHGEFNPDIAAGARLVQYVIRRWSVRPKNDDLLITVPSEPEYGVIVDAVQGITTATFGNGRLRCQPGGFFEFRFGEHEISATPRELGRLSLTEIRIEPMERLFVLSEV